MKYSGKNTEILSLLLTKVLSLAKNNAQIECVRGWAKIYKRTALSFLYKTAI